ncbi:unnamed protein product [Diamesa tonsa]
MTEALVIPSANSNAIIVPAGVLNGFDKHKEYQRQNGSANQIVATEPPDGGYRAWIVLVSAFLCNGILFGVINSYSVIFMSLQRQLDANGDKEASAKAALVGSLTIGTTFLFSPVSGILVDKLGLRITTFLGGVLTCSGMYLSSIYTDNVNALCLSYGFMFGMGAALAYTPTLAILGHYFKRYLGVANGFVTAGSSAFTVFMPKLLTHLEENHGLEKTIRFMAILSSFVMLCALVYKPLQPPPIPPRVKPGRTVFNNFMRSIINFDNWKKKKYIIWALSIPVALFGYFVPYVHISKFVKETFPTEDVNLPLMCIAVASGCGRILFGFIADFPGVNRIMLQQISFLFIGGLTMLLSTAGSFKMMLVFALGLGLFDGCFISLLGPIAYDICGPRGATQAIGFLLGMCSLPLTVGPPAAGKLYDIMGSYTFPFVLAGVPPLIGATTMLFIRCIKDDRTNDDDIKDQQPLSGIPQVAWDNENQEKRITNGGNAMNLAERKATLASLGINTHLLTNHNISSLMLESHVVGWSRSNMRKYAYSYL